MRMKPALELLREIRARAVPRDFLLADDEVPSSSADAPVVEASEEIAAVLLRSPEFGDVWLARDDREAQKLVDEVQAVGQWIPVFTFDEAALLHGKSDGMLRALLMAKAGLPGSRLLQ
jgi:hypothetical protein